MPDISDLVSTAVLITKIKEVERYGAKLLDIEETTLLHLIIINKELIDTKKIKRLVEKSDISNLKKNSDLNTNLTALATKTELKAQ